ncbi:DUF962 domain-containing protein [Mycobacterium sp. NBC_00419]|uniref:DUF962 domain-containing protein n=1 Tax=Mycobacterium sp. NBC_00419 TaxID=2975989 RepID=UPI002E1A6E59
MTAPAVGAPFAEKMAYYRTQHTSRGVKLTHLVGLPVIVWGIPLLAARPRIGAAMFLGGWALQIAGHVVFEKNLPSTHKGWITYQLTGVIDVCETYGDILARRGARKALRRVSVPPATFSARVRVMLSRADRSVNYMPCMNGSASHDD